MTEIKVTLSSPKIIATVTQGMNGKTAYQSAVTGGYTGTEAEFNTLMANVPSNATQVPFTPTGNLSSTNVQTALAELDTEKAPTVHTHDDRYYTETEVNNLLRATNIANTPSGNISSNTVS